MLMRLVFILVFPLLASGADDVHAQHAKLGRGINLGNALEGPHEGAWGRKLEEADFPRIKNAGFDSVRIPVRWSAHEPPRPPLTRSTRPGWRASTT